MSAQSNTSLHNIIKQRQRSPSHASSTSSKVKNSNFMKKSKEPFMPPPPPTHQYPTAKPDSQNQQEIQIKDQKKKQNNSIKNIRAEPPRPDTHYSVNNEPDIARIQQPSVLQHKLTLLLQSHAQKEQKYSKTIKQMKEQMYNVTQSYMESLNNYKKQLHKLLQKQNNSEKLKQKYDKMHQLYYRKTPTNKYQLIQSDQQILASMNLFCQIKILDIQFLLEDYMTQYVPKKISIKITGWKNCGLIKEQSQIIATVGQSLTQQEITESIINMYPFDVCTKQLNKPIFDFSTKDTPNNISQLQQILNSFRTKSLRIQIIDCFSQLTFCSGRIDLQQFLFCNKDGEQEQWVTKIALFSEQYPSQIASYIHIESINYLIKKQNSSHHVHKVSQPINVLPKKMKADKEARIVQRISSYKNQHSTIIPQINKHVLSETDKLILQHKKKRQLQEIQEYKQLHKEEYMDKLFREAVEIYQTQSYPLGQCRYIGFVYSNITQRAQRISVDIKATSKSSTDHKNNQNQSQISRQLINVQVLKPETCFPLIDNNIMHYPANCSDDMLDYNYDSDGKILVMSGYSILVFAKVILHSVKKNCDKEKLTFMVLDEYGREIFNNAYMLKIQKPSIDHTFKIDMARGQQIRLKLDLSSEKDRQQHRQILGKAKAVNILKNYSTTMKDSGIQFQYLWQGNCYQNLDVKIQCGTKTSFIKQFNAYMFVYDINYTKMIACYQLIINVCPVLDFVDKSHNMAIIEGIQNKKVDKLDKKRINIGEAVTFTFDLQIPMSENSPSDSILVRLGCSDITHLNCKVTHKGNNQILCEKNKSYPIQISYLSFKQKPTNIKQTVTIVDCTSQKILKKYLLFLEKNPSSYRKVYSLHCPNEQIFITTLDLYNSPASNKGAIKQKMYRFKSSNPSYIRPPTQPIVLMSGQATKVKLQVQFWANGADFQSGQSLYDNASYLTEGKKVKDVVISVDDGNQTLLYLYQLRQQ